MGIDRLQLVIIVRVGMLISSRVIGVIHTGAQIGIIKGFILMVQPEGMAHFLAHDQITPGRGVVGGCIEIGVV